jgi:hypothetical protein
MGKKSRITAFIEENSFRILLALMLFVIIAGVAYSYHLGMTLKYLDERHYYTLASNLVSEHRYTLDGITPCAYRPPGYPFLLTPLVYIGADVIILRIINFIALAVCIAVVYKIVVSRGSRFAGIVGSVLVLCYPVLFYTAGTLYPQTIASLCLLLVIARLGKKTLSIRDYAIVGFWFGCMILLAPSFLFSIPPIFLWMWCARKNQWAKGILVILLVPLLMSAPWMIRNYRAFHSFVFISANSGQMLLYGNSENTTPNAGPNVDISRYYPHGMKLDDARIDAHLRSEAIHYAMTHKAQSVKMYALKVINNFNWRNDLATSGAGSRLADTIMLLTYGPLLAASVLRLAMSRRWRLSSFEWLLIILYICNAFTSAIFFTRIRYRLPFDFLLIILAAMFINTIRNRANIDLLEASDKLISPRV